MPSKHDIDEAAVAYLAAEGKTQARIGAMLNLSQSAVSRLLQLAEEKYLEKRSSYTFKENTLNRELMNEVLRRVSRKEVAKHLDHLARKNGHPSGPIVRVFPVTPNHETMAAKFNEFTVQAAPYVHSLLNRAAVKICGVTWGYMLYDLAVALRKAQNAWKKDQVEVIPLSGDPIQDRGDDPPSLTSSNIASDLGKIINGDSYRAPWLGLVPAFIPEQFSPKDMVVIERMVQMVPDYEAIFGNDSNTKQATAGRLDILLTSVGTAARPLGFGNGRLLSSLGPKLERLKTEIYGDVGGALLPQDPAAPSKLVQAIEKRWKGIKRTHLASCAKRAMQEDAHTGRPGVVVLSLGADRAQVIAAAVAQGLVNHLIIDQELEESLEKLIPRMLDS